jgi:hypothetical protein
MNVEEILRRLGEQRDRLDIAISALGGGDGTGTHEGAKRRGRPPGTKNKLAPAAGEPKKRGGMSAAAGKRIAEAMRKRWAAAKKSGKKKL